VVVSGGRDDGPDGVADAGAAGGADGGADGGASGGGAGGGGGGAVGGGAGGGGGGGPPPPPPPPPPADGAGGAGAGAGGDGAAGGGGGGAPPPPPPPPAADAAPPADGDGAEETAFPPIDLAGDGGDGDSADGDGGDGLDDTIVDEDGDGVADDTQDDDGLFGETPEESPEAAAECFPAAATVELRDGRTVAMADLAVGDAVRVAPGSTDAAFSRVFMFTHKRPTGTYPMVTLTTGGGVTLTATRGHYVYANGRATAAAAVVVGDALTLASGADAAVTAVGRSVGVGLYNPQTLHGDVVVDGVRASTYTTAVAPGVAAALLAPLRAAYTLTGYSSAALHGGGAARVVALLPRGAPVPVGPSEL